MFTLLRYRWLAVAYIFTHLVGYIWLSGLNRANKNVRVGLGISGSGLRFKPVYKPGLRVVSILTKACRLIQNLT